MDFQNSKIKRITIEVTNQCALKCPECARNRIEQNKYIHDLSIKENLSLDFFRKHFTKELAKENFELHFSGNYGDCIYHPQFLDIVEYLKSINFKLHIETNGSHKARKWWEKLASIVTFEDRITFSIDGLEDTNSIYRINSNFHSAIEAIKIMKDATYTSWKFIVFSHNEHQVETAKAFAKTLGIHSFKINKSGRFKSNDKLKPSQKKWVGIKTQNKTIIRKALKTRNQILFKVFPFLILFNKNKTKRKSDIKILPRCKTGTSLFLSSDGYLYPCCTSRDLTKSSWFLKNREQWNLNKLSFDEVINSNIWKTLDQKFSKPQCAPSECLRYCGVSKEFLEVFENDPKYIDRDGVDIENYVLNEK